jgi:Domain of unknown function (DUF4177)
MMAYEYKVVEERFGSPKETEDCLNDMAADGWEHYQISTLGPIPSRWLYFRRERKE